MIEIGMAVVLYNGKILIARRQKHRKQGGLWEFPGGKIESGETVQDCIRREYMEELDLPVTVGDFFREDTYHYDDIGSVCLHTYWATCNRDKVSLMTAHDEIAWVKPEDLDNYAFCPADKPIIEALKQKFL